MEWKYLCAQAILCESGIEPTIRIMGELGETSQKLTEKQMRRKLNKLPDPLPGEQQVFFDGPLDYPDQEIHLRLLNLKAFLLENGESTYSNNILCIKHTWHNLYITP